MDKSKQTSLTSHFKPLPNTTGNEQHLHDPPMNGGNHPRFNHPAQNKHIHGNQYYNNQSKNNQTQQSRHKENFSSSNSYRHPQERKENYDSFTRPSHSGQYPPYKSQNYYDKGQHNAYQKSKSHEHRNQNPNRNFDQYKYREKSDNRHQSISNQDSSRYVKNGDSSVNGNLNKPREFDNRQNQQRNHPNFHTSKQIGHSQHMGDKNPNIVWSTKPITIKPKIESTNSLNKPKSESLKAENPPEYKSPEVRELEDKLEKKKGLIRSIDLKKLPDGGKRLQDQIDDLKAKLKEVKLKELANPPQPPKTTAEDKIKEVTSKLDVIDLTDAESDKYNERPPDQYYGGRMTAQRITTVAKVTTEAIEDLHESLETCPTLATTLKDPKGLLVNLMMHQCQALAWMVWREKQLVSGGILADDMGLGKTLTMIALILKQNELQLKNKLKHKDEECSGNQELVDKSEKKKDVEEISKKENDDSEVNQSKVVGGTLIVAPASLIFHWECEINNRCEEDLLSVHLFHGNKREKTTELLADFDVVITTYNLVRTCHGKLDNETKIKSKEVEDTLFQIKWKRIILDESHQIKNYKSQTSVAACALYAHSRWAMSGTPVQNDESDMFAMIKFLHCKPFNEYKLWKNQVSNKTYRGQQRLKTLVSCFVLRREKGQKGMDGKPIVDLPTRTFETHKLQLDKVEQEVYDKLKSESQAAFTKYEKNKQMKPYPGESTTSHYFDSKTSKPDEKKFTSTTLLVMLLRLRQCCGHLSLLKNKFDTDLLENEKKEIAVEDLFSSMSIANSASPFKADQIVEKDKLQYFDISSSSSKIKFVMDRLNILNFESPDDKCVIISQWTSMLKVLAYHLKKADFSFDVIDGSVSAKKRMDLVNSFNKPRMNPKIMLVSLQAGGVGLNLVGGNHLFLIDMHWNPALEKQAFDRIYRVGQKKKVFVHKFVVEKTVEEQILKLQERKLSIANSVMEGADRDNKVKLSLADMKSLFGIN